MYIIDQNNSIQLFQCTENEHHYYKMYFQGICNNSLAKHLLDYQKVGFLNITDHGELSTETPKLTAIRDRLSGQLPDDFRYLVERIVLSEDIWTIINFVGEKQAEVYQVKISRKGKYCCRGRWHMKFTHLAVEFLA